MKTRTREIAHAGVFGSRDDPHVVSAHELEEIAQTFAEVKPAPIRLGSHYSEGRPRLGNVIAVRYNPETKSLEADIEEHDTLAAVVDQGLYPDVSIGAKQRASDGRMYLHHLAYLGDTPPAIKDLYSRIDEQLSANESAAEIFAADDDTARDFRALPPTKSVLLLDDQNKESTPAKPEEHKEGQMTEEEINAMKTENERLKAEAEEKERLLADRLAAERAAEKEALRAAASGKVTIPQMGGLMELADAFAEGRTIELADESGKKAKCSPVKVLTDIFAALPCKVEQGMLNLSDGRENKKRENLAAKMLGHI